jgi:hypothetical protein
MLCVHNVWRTTGFVFTLHYCDLSKYLSIGTYHNCPSQGTYYVDVLHVVIDRPRFCSRYYHNLKYCCFRMQNAANTSAREAEERTLMLIAELVCCAVFACISVVREVHV